MTSRWRRHFIVCFCLGLLAVPIHFIDQALGAGGGGIWISLDFRGVIFWSYVVWLAIEVTLSSVAVRLFPRSRVLGMHIGVMALALILLIVGVFVYGELGRSAISGR